MYLVLVVLGDYLILKIDKHFCERSIMHGKANLEIELILKSSEYAIAV